jgi:hypothetical protein
MLSRKEFILLFLVMVLAISASSQEKAVSVPAKDSIISGISEDENILFNMINDIRRQAHMSLIPLSTDLCTVAHIHINDLLFSKPQENGCGVHSWSASGKWTPCCNAKDPGGIQCMKSKPKEITGYPGNGYELIYWGEDKATPADAAELWKQVGASSDMILCRGKWKNYQWKAIGIGIKDGYAVLWLGDKADKKVSLTQDENLVKVPQSHAEEISAAKMPATEAKTTRPESALQPKVAEGKEEPNNPSAGKSSPKFYLIAASNKSADEAQTSLKRVKAKGYPDAYILGNVSPYRITIESFENNKLASKRLYELKKDFPDIWILKK